MINKTPRSFGPDTPKTVLDLYRTADELVEQSNQYLPPVSTYQMGYVNTTVGSANTFTPFLTSTGITALYSDTVPTSIVEVQVFYYSGATNFTVRLRESLASNPQTLLTQTALGGVPVVTSRLLSMASFSVGACVTRASTPYLLEVSSPSSSATFVLAANLKVVRGIRP